MFHSRRADVLFIVCEIILLSVNHERLLMQISGSGKHKKSKRGWNFDAIWASVFEKRAKIKLQRAIFSACHFADKFAALWICRAMFLQRAFQFCFLNTVETLSFFSLMSSLEFVLHWEKFISLLASPPIYRWKFQLCTVACVAGVWKRSEVEFKAGEKRKGRGARGGREGNTCQEIIVFAIAPNNYVCKKNRNCEWPSCQCLSLYWLFITLKEEMNLIFYLICVT